MSKPSPVQESPEQQSSQQADALPRLFRLTYDHSKMQTKNVWEKPHLTDAFTCWGVLYPDGGVGLQASAYFPTMDALHAYLDKMGEYRIEWVNGEERR